MTKFRGERTQAATGKLVTYEVEFDRVEGDVAWTLRILVTGGRWIEVVKGILHGVPRDVSVAQILVRETAPHVESVDWKTLDAGS